MRYREEDEYEYGERYPPHMHSSSRYPQQYNSFAAPYNYQPIPPPQLPFPNVSTPSPYPVIPPVPPRHHYSSSAPIIPGNSYLSQPNVHMPEPAPAAPVYPNQPMPGGPVIPNMSYPSAHPHASSFPVIPPPLRHFLSPGWRWPGTATSDEYTPSPNMREGQPLAPGQYGQAGSVRPPGSVKFHHNPLPTPPKDLFELSPYVGY
ncbi:hypothetical protein BC629DRAFT_1593664 [Irpex lacteus]|nr:hypothetical protein BC629DRAFT_1593664 [Irpex lacteus]